VKGKPWTVEEEKRLREMVAAGCNAHEIALDLNRNPNAVYEKAKRLGLRVIISCKSGKIITTNLKLPEELPSVEEQLKVLAGALNELKTPGLEQADVLRLRSVIQGVKIYKELLADYVDYRGLERELGEWREKYAILAKNKKSQGVQT
jgi:hypothetical protein